MSARQYRNAMLFYRKGRSHSFMYPTLPGWLGVVTVTHMHSDVFGLVLGTASSIASHEQTSAAHTVPEDIRQILHHHHSDSASSFEKPAATCKCSR